MNIDIQKKVDEAQIHYIVTQHSLSNDTIGTVFVALVCLMLAAKLIFG